MIVANTKPLQIVVKWLHFSKVFEIPETLWERYRRFLTDEDAVAQMVAEILSGDTENTDTRDEAIEDPDELPELDPLKAAFEVKTKQLMELETKRAVLRRKVYDTFMETRILAIRLSGVSARLHSQGAIDSSDRERDLAFIEKYLVQFKLTG